MSFSLKKKETTIQETFYNLCKDLIRYIDRKIIKKYISPNQAQVPKEKRIIEKKYNDDKWRYFFEDEETTEEDRIRDIFKDNNFLFNLQNLYNSLNILVNNFEENKKNLEELEKKIEMENQRSKLFGEINSELIKYLIENKININNLNQNDIIKACENLKNNDIIKNISPDMIQQFLNNSIKNEIPQNNYFNNNNNFNIEQNINNNSLNNNNTLNTNKETTNSNSIDVNKKITQNENKLFKNKSIPTLIQALESINKSKNNKNPKKVMRKNKILDSDSEDSDSDNDEEDNNDEVEEFKKEENKINLNNNEFYNQRNKKDKYEIKNFINRKSKRKKNKK